MTLLLPDVNVWVALSHIRHIHGKTAWKWFHRLPTGARVIFGRYTHLGLLRLLTNTAAMGVHKVTLGQAWSAYDTWLADPRVDFYPEPVGLHADFRQATMPLDESPATKWVGDCYLLAFAKGCGATLVTFDRPLASFAKKHGYRAIIPA